MIVALRPLVFVFAATALAIGCGGGSADVSDAARAVVDAGTADAGSCVPTTPFGGGEVSVSGTKSVTAKFVNETGAPVAGQPLYISGLDISSSPAVTDASGNASISTSLSERKPAFKAGDAVDYAELAIPLTMATTDFTAGGTSVLVLGKLSDKPGATLTPGMSATSGDVTIFVPAGATLGIDDLVYVTTDQQKLRTVGLPVASDNPVLTSSGHADFALLYGLAPAETPICPPAKVTVRLPHATMSPNDLGWAPGTAVEFWITTTDTGQTYAPYAGWTKASDGVVSNDGTSVSTVGGFTYLQSFAIRKP